MTNPVVKQKMRLGYQSQEGKESVTSARLPRNEDHHAPSQQITLFRWRQSLESSFDNLTPEWSYWGGGGASQGWFGHASESGDLRSWSWGSLG